MDIMKVISKGINEALQQNQFNETELRNDLETLSAASLKERKAIGVKYGLDSGKFAEVANAIYELLRDVRKNKTEFSTEDFKEYSMYARSIWAAEYSTLVTPHLRFFITNRK